MSVKRKKSKKVEKNALWHKREYFQFKLHRNWACILNNPVRFCLNLNGRQDVLPSFPEIRLTETDSACIVFARPIALVVEPRHPVWPLTTAADFQREWRKPSEAAPSTQTSVYPGQYPMPPFRCGFFFIAPRFLWIQTWFRKNCCVFFEKIR